MTKDCPNWVKDYCTYLEEHLTDLSPSDKASQMAYLVDRFCQCSKKETCYWKAGEINWHASRR